MPSSSSNRTETVGPTSRARCVRALSEGYTVVAKPTNAMFDALFKAKSMQRSCINILERSIKRVAGDGSKKRALVCALAPLQAVPTSAYSNKPSSCRVKKSASASPPPESLVLGQGLSPGSSRKTPRSYQMPTASCIIPVCHPSLSNSLGDCPFLTASYTWSSRLSSLLASSPLSLSPLYSLASVALVADVVVLSATVAHCSCEGDDASAGRCCRHVFDPWSTHFICCGR